MKQITGLVLAILTLAAGAGADSLEAARRARQVLDQGAVALGGMEALQAVGPPTGRPGPTNETCGRSAPCDARGGGERS